jgi:hypothetical protein
MSDYNPEPQKKIEELEQHFQNQEIANTLKLSRKNIGTAVFISILLPIGGYIYTGRWKALGITFSSLVAVLTLCILAQGNRLTEKFEDDLTASAAVILSIIVPIDNASAIKRARKKIEELKK